MILDATCGLKGIWFKKTDEETVYLDKRKGPIYSSKTLQKRSQRRIEPTIQADNRFLPFKDSMFDLVIYDPPHVIETEEHGMFLERYGHLKPSSYVKDIYLSSRECLRVLKPKGFLVFKWAESPHGRSVRRVLSIFPIQPLFGSVNPTQRNPQKTYWIVFRKD